jgi:hypothetical protein
MSFEVQFGTLRAFLDINTIIYIEMTPTVTGITEEKFDIEIF